jgi:hypothetical protein
LEQHLIRVFLLKDSNLKVDDGTVPDCEYLPVLHLLPTTDKRTQNRGSCVMWLQNYMFSLYLPTVDVSPDHWVQRSVAAFITT